MTRTISLIIGIAVVALVAVPTALGEGQLAGSQDPQVYAPDWFERAAIAAQRSSSSQVVVSEQTPEPAWMRAERLRGEALNEKYGASTTSVASYKDAHERVVESQFMKALQLRSEGLNREYGLGEFSPMTNYKDAHERADVPTASPADVPVATSGRDVEWPQIGIGFGIGIALALLLGLSLKATRPRTLAH
jgi:hypothetical protein